MRNAAIISACVHVLVIALIYFGLPTLFAPKPVQELPVPVDIVSLQDAPTAAMPPPKAAPKPAPPKPTPPKPAPPKPPPPPKAETPPPPPPPTPPEPPKATPAPEPPPPPKAEIVPTPKEKPKPPPKPKPAPKPEPQQQAAVAPPAPVPKRKPKPPPDQFQALLKNLAKEKAQEEKAEKTEKAPKKEPPKKSEPFDVNSLVASLKPSQRSSIDKRRMGANLAQMIQQQITPCWSIPGGAKDVQDMKIAVHIQLNQDGTLRGAPRLEDTRRMQSDPFYRAVAESALRALRNPSCSPLKLPLDQYDLWQDITFVFEPGEALGQ